MPGMLELEEMASDRGRWFVLPHSGVKRLHGSPFGSATYARTPRPSTCRLPWHALKSFGFHRSFCQPKAARTPSWNAGRKPRIFWFARVG